MTAPIRAAILCDYREERWPSMDLVAEMILAALARRPPEQVRAEAILPSWRHRAAGLPVLGRSGAARNADRLLNRFLDYPRHLRKVAAYGRFDLFHLADHSYAQLLHALPRGRSVVTCHDLDTFRCLLDPASEPRPRWFRAMARRVLSGLQEASAVACDTEATRAAILRHGLLPPDRLRVVHLGTSPEFSAGPDPESDASASEVLGPPAPDGPPILLHVGSNIPRKRIDVLLNVFAGVRRACPSALLAKVGGRLTPDQLALADRLGIADHIAYFPYLDPSRRGVIAAAYRRAALTLVPSDAEGFGLPVAEAMACGSIVLASDLPVLREVGGDAALYRPVGDVEAWIDAAIESIGEMIDNSDVYRSRRESGIARAARFTWDAHADSLVEMYRDVLSGRPAGRSPEV